MTILVPKPTITPRLQRRLLWVAAVADSLQMVLLPLLLPGIVLDDVIDAIVAVVLLATVGFRWRFAVVFLAELIPGLGALPTWVLVVMTLPVKAAEGPIEVRTVRVPPRLDSKREEREVVEGEVEER